MSEDSITRQVEALYTRHPYPSRAPQLRADSFAHRLLGYVDRGHEQRSLHILDAGCGTGAALIPIAELYPDARVVGIDLSPAAIAAVDAERRRRELHNLEVHRMDLLDPDTVEQLRTRAPQGFDVIYASGVVHHLAAPERGLAHLARLLAPHGVLSLMVYGHHGRMPVTRMARAVALARPGVGADDDRLAFARRMLGALGQGSVASPPWDDVNDIDDVELVDRYLHVRARSFTVAELVSLVEGAGLRWLRWLEPRLWSPRYIFEPGPLADELEALPELVRWQIVEQLFDRRNLEVLLVRPEARPRPVATMETLRQAMVARNPQAAIHIIERSSRMDTWVEHVSVRLRGGPETGLPGVHGMLVQACSRPLAASDLIASVASAFPGSSDAIWQALHELVLEDVLYEP